MKSGFISVVLPVYNGEKYLEKSIQSIMGQTYRNWELLIIDDCSTDSTPAIIKDFCQSDPRIKSVRHEKNKRLPASLNTGFRLTKGDYVTWTSDDNLYKPNAFQEMAGFLDEHREISFIYSDFDLIDEMGEVIEQVTAGDWKMLGLMDVIGGCFMYRRIIHETIGYYDEATYLAEDLEFELRAMVNGYKFQPLHKNLYQYRSHADSLTNTKSKQIYRIHAEVNKKYFDRMPWMDRQTKAHSFLRLARKALEIRDFSAVLWFLSESLRQDPLHLFKSLFTRLSTNSKSPSNS